MIGKWDDPTAQKVTADAIAVHKKFDAITAQGGDTGVVQAMLDAKHPMVPFGGENRERLSQVLRQIRESRFEVCVGRDRAGSSRGGDQDGDRGAGRQGRTAVGEAAFGAGRVPEPEGRDRLLRRPVRQNFFVGNSFPTAASILPAQEIMGQSEANK